MSTPFDSVPCALDAILMFLWSLFNAVAWDWPASILHQVCGWDAGGLPHVWGSYTSRESKRSPETDLSLLSCRRCLASSIKARLKRASVKHALGRMRRAVRHWRVRRPCAGKRALGQL